MAASSRTSARTATKRAPRRTGSSRRSAATALPSAGLDDDGKVALYRTMLLVRRFEEQVIALFQEGVLPGFLHVAIGQEAIAAGVGHALQDDDYIGSTHRAHGHILARGSSPDAMMAEMMGRTTGLCQGKGGSMHLSDMSRNVVGANGVVGAGAPMMTGVAFAQKQLGTDRIAVAFYGDGATNQGNVHEAMNLAQLWKLPVLFICENNRYAESTPYWQQVPVEDLAVRGAAFDMKTLSVDGNDVHAVYDATVEAAEHARSGAGPVYIVAETTRIEGHYVGDSESYRPKGEVKEARKADPLPRYRTQLEGDGIDAARLDAVETEAGEVIDAAVASARSAPVPEPEDSMRHVYAEFPYEGPVRGL